MDDPPIRTVPLVPQDGGPPGRRTPPGWVAVVLVVSGLAVLTIALGATSDGTAAEPEAGDDLRTVATTPEPPTTEGLGRSPTTGTTTIGAPTLAELFPGVGSEGIRIAYRDPTSRHTLVSQWAGTSPEPAPPLPGIGMAAANYGAFAASGTRFAAWGGSGLVVDRVTIAAGVSAWNWHPETTAMAWTVQPPGSDEQVLFHVADSFAEPVEVTRLPAASSLVAWGDWGYAVTVSYDDGPVQGPGGPEQLVMTTLLSPAGDPVTSVAAMVLAASPAGSLVLWGFPTAFSAALEGGRTIDELTMVDEMIEAMPGTFLLDTEGATTRLGEFPSELARWHLFVPGGNDDPLAVTPYADGWTVDIVGGDGLRLPPARLDRAQTGGNFYPIGFSEDGRWLVFTDGPSMAFHDWRLGETHEVPFPLGDVIDVHL